MKLVKILMLFFVISSYALHDKKTITIQAKDGERFELNKELVPYIRVVDVALTDAPTDVLPLERFTKAQLQETFAYLERVPELYREKKVLKLTEANLKENASGVGEVLARQLLQEQVALERLAVMEYVADYLQIQGLLEGIKLALYAQLIGEENKERVMQDDVLLLNALKHIFPDVGRYMAKLMVGTYHQVVETGRLNFEDKIESAVFLYEDALLVIHNVTADSYDVSIMKNGTNVITVSNAVSPETLSLDFKKVFVPTGAQSGVIVDIVTEKQWEIAENNISLLSNASTFLTGDEDHIYLKRIDGTTIATFPGDADVTSASITGNKMVIRDANFTSRIVDTETGVVVDGRIFAFTDCILSPDASKAVLIPQVERNDVTTLNRVIDVRTGAVICQQDLASANLKYVFSNDSNYLVARSARGFRLKRAADCRIIKDFENVEGDVAFSPGSKFVLAQSSKDKLYWAMTTSNGEPAVVAQRPFTIQPGDTTIFEAGFLCDMSDLQPLGLREGGIVAVSLDGSKVLMALGKTIIMYALEPLIKNPSLEQALFIQAAASYVKSGKKVDIPAGSQREKIWESFDPDTQAILKERYKITFGRARSKSAPPHVKKRRVEAVVQRKQDKHPKVASKKKGKKSSRIV